MDIEFGRTLRAEMDITITAQPAYLRVDIFDRLAGPEGEHQLRRIAEESRKRRQPRILVNSHRARPMAEFEYFMLLKLAQAMNLRGDCSVALIDEAAEASRLNQFGKTVVRQDEANAPEREPNVKAFADVSVALKWLLKDAESAGDACC